MKVEARLIETDSDAISPESSAQDGDKRDSKDDRDPADASAVGHHQQAGEDG